ncbi:hypothetical protein [Streptomyces sp. NPDC088757]|uniref:hypothetical protein n=1 Tax=Streptomyces sp. NPDC088757 TaxID=3365889 RepID=UPI0037F73553
MHFVWEAVVESAEHAVEQVPQGLGMPVVALTAAAIVISYTALDAQVLTKV